MKRPVRWSREALDDIKQQVRFIAEDNPAAARRVRQRILETGEALGDMATGRPGRVAGIYEKSVRRLPYIMAYELFISEGREIVWILRVIHASRDWPDGEWPE